MKFIVKESKEEGLLPQLWIPVSAITRIIRTGSSALRILWGKKNISTMMHPTAVM